MICSALRLDIYSSTLKRQNRERDMAFCLFSLGWMVIKLAEDIFTQNASLATPRYRSGYS